MIPPNRDPTFIKPGSHFGGTFFSPYKCFIPLCKDVSVFKVHV